MANAVSFMGMNTGLPPDLVDKLVDSQRTRLNTFNQGKTGVKNVQISINGLEGKLSALKSLALKFQDNASFTPRVAASSATDKVGVTVGSTAQAGVHQVTVETLASHATLVMGIGNGGSGAAPGAGISAADSASGLSGTIAFSFSYNGATYNQTDLGLAAGDSLNTIANKINNHKYGTNDGVAASVMNDGSGLRLVITAKDSGAFVRDPATGATTTPRISGLTANLTMGTATIATGSFFQTDPGNDAKLTVDGITNIFSASNQVSSVIEGVTMDLKALGSATISVTNDTTKLKTTLQEFIDSFNGVVDYIAAESKKSSAFASDAMVRGVLAKLRSELHNDTGGVSGQFTNLAQMGITTDRYTGKLAIGAKFATLSADSYQSVAEIFTAEPATGNKGLAFRLESMIKSLTGANDGVFAGKKRSLDARIKTYDESITRETMRLENLRKRYTAQFSNLESLASSMNSAQNSMMTALSKMR